MLLDTLGHNTPVLPIELTDSTTAALSWNARIGRFYTVEQSTNLIDWTALTDYVEVLSNPRSSEVSIEANDTSFYRVWEAPPVGSDCDTVTPKRHQEGIIKNSKKIDRGRATVTIKHRLLLVGHM